MSFESAFAWKDAPAEPVAVLEFGRFRLIPRRRQLLVNGASVRIGARAFDLLAALAMHPGEVLSHAELIRRGWPNLVVSDCNLKVQIAALQKILGDAPCGGRHIASVTARGYVFVADVRRFSMESQESHDVQDDRGPDAYFEPAVGSSAAEDRYAVI